MASRIVPTNIDGTFPVAGQDNSSQGFRDNFTNTKNNFTFARNEISDLQSKALLTAALDGSTLNNDMAGTQLIRPQLKAWTQALVDLGSISGTATINFTVGNFQKITAAGAVTLALSGWPSVGTAGGYGAVRVWIVVSDYTTQTLTLPASVSIGVDTITGYNSGTDTITFDANGNYIFDFSSIDGGATYFIADPMRNRTTAGGFATVTQLNANVTAANAAIVTANSAVVSYVNTLNSAMRSNVTAANAAIVTANSAVVSYVNTLNSAMNANVTAANAAIVTANTGLKAYVDTLTSATTTTYTTTIADNGSGIQYVFAIDGIKIKTNTGVTATGLKFTVGAKYKFDISGATNANAQIAFSTTADTWSANTITPYTTGVTTVGTAGSPGAYVEILVSDVTPNPLYLYAIETSFDTSKYGGETPIPIVKMQTTGNIVTTGSTRLSGNVITSGGLQAIAIGNVTPGTGAFTTLTSSGNLFVSNTYVPSLANSTGATGQISYDTSYVYICLGANNWKRANLAAW
jgi:hypothetical protein